ncbi:NAD-dependent epimerase/dehydratase family protein [Novosphingobium sp. FSY-8]|uniref:NAD-dependent epimerase/dehydratase family protein n=2 Tax=Novosphingobium ovatum TaxID=1908523 RepID=A0ABW9XGF7_9SPHN|nr:NAD-dependent epimerase/dehydratase family protein [Novosphingobium ovatum]
MKVLVLGARGFIGGEIVQRLAADPAIEVIPAGRGAPAQIDGAWSRYRAFDLHRPLDWAAAMAGCDAIINCTKFPQGEDANQRLMQAMIEAARQAGVRRLIHFSSMSAFGSANAAVIDEETVPVAPFSAYGRDKLLTEQVCADHAGQGLSILVLRPTLVYGPGGLQWYDYFVNALRRGRLRRLRRNGDGVANLVYVGDVARLCRDALDRDLPPYAMMVVNGPDLITFNDYFALLARKLMGQELAWLDRSRRVWNLRRVLFRLMRKAGQRLPALRAIAEAHIFALEPWVAYTAPSHYQSAVAEGLGLNLREPIATVLDRLAG